MNGFGRRSQLSLLGGPASGSVSDCALIVRWLTVMQALFSPDSGLDTWFGLSYLKPNKK